MKNILLVFFLTFASFSYSQDKQNLWGGLEIGYGISLSDNGNSHNISYTNNNKMSISSIKIILGYYIIPQLSLGAGVGLNSYTRPGLNTLPIWLDIKYYPFVNQKIQLNSSIGYSIITSENNQNAKLLTDISIGYKLFNRKRINFIPSIGYNYCNYSVEELRQFRHSLFLKIGVTF